jgi:hypothetical protein
MDETAADNALRWYEDLEAQLIEVLRFIPPQGGNLTNWSPKTATITVEACNLLESVLYHITPPSVPIKGKPKDRKHLLLTDYGELYAAQLRLAERKAAVFQAPFRWLTPYSSWAGLPAGTSLQNPEWWAVHNRSKHRRLDHYSEFTISRAFEALAGAMITIVTMPTCSAARPLIDAMIRHKWIDTPGEVADCLPDFYMGKYPPRDWICPETSLFAVLLGNPEVPENLDSLVASQGTLWGGQKLRLWLRR